MGIEEVKDLIYDIYLDFENEITDFDYKGMELTQEEVDVSLNLLEQFMNMLDVKLDDKLEDTKNKIKSLTKYDRVPFPFGKENLSLKSGLLQYLSMSAFIRSTRCFIISL